MYKLFSIIVILACCLTAGATHPVHNKATLKVLDIGNSFTNDATDLLPLITEASGSDASNICLYKAIRSSGSFKSWYDVYCDKDSAYTYRIEKVFGGLSANVSTGRGDKGDGSLFRKLLTDEQWDIIIIQPYYGLQSDASRGDYLNKLLSVIKEHQPNAVIGFYIVHSLWDHHAKNKEGSSYERWKQVCSSTKSLQEEFGIDFILPYGTAIENLRSSSLNNEYDLTRDGLHLAYGLGRYTAACCYYESLIAPRSGISVLGNSARYDASQAADSQYPSISVTDENALIAQEAACLAVKDMYQCQNPEAFIFKLIYNVDGDVYKSVNMVSGMTISPEASPTKEGYTFSGWSEIPSTMPAEDVTVTGNFTINKYRLVYMLDGAEYKSMEVEYGTAITPEPAPAKEGYTFSGWSDIPTTMPAKDVVVEGIFSINKYKLVYMVDGAEYKTYEVELGGNITPEALPTKEGYTFSGWSEIPSAMPAQDVTVTGNFTINKYRLVYMLDGTEYKSMEVEYGAAITLEPAPTKDGYTFSGWSDIPTTMPAKDVVVEGIFSINKYKLVYMVDGAEYKTYEVELGGNITPEALPTKEGYTFSGWSDIPSTMPAQDVTVTGSFTINKYRLVYMLDGVEYKSLEVEYGATITPEPDPTKEGYTFSGWSDIPATMPANDVTVMGSFKEEVGIKNIVMDSPGARIYDMLGNRIDQVKIGVNIIRMDDGKAKKVLVKKSGKAER